MVTTGALKQWRAQKSILVCGRRAYLEADGRDRLVMGRLGHGGDHRRLTPELSAVKQTLINRPHAVK